MRAFILSLLQEENEFIFSMSRGMLLALIRYTHTQGKGKKILYEGERRRRRREKEECFCFFYFLFFFFLWGGGGESRRNGLERCRMSSFKQRKTGIRPYVVCSFPSLYSWPDAPRKKREHMTCLTSLHCVCVCVVQRGFQSAWLELLPPTPHTQTSETLLTHPLSLSAKKKRTLSHQRNILQNKINSGFWFFASCFFQWTFQLTG